MCFGRLMSFWQSLRPHFLCRYSDGKFARRPPKLIASVVSGHSWKGKKRQICIEKSLRNCPFFDIDRLFGFDRLFAFYERKVHLDKVGKDKRNRYSKRICATRQKAKRLKTNYMTKHRTHNTRLCALGG